MKMTLKPILAGLLMITAAFNSFGQSIINQNATWSLTGSNQTFTFSQFDSSLGSLTAVDFIVNSSSVSGTASITNEVGFDILVSALLSRIRVEGTGFTALQTTNTSLNSSPGSLTLSDGATQAYTVSSTSLLGLPATRSIGAGSLSNYIGGGNTPNFTSRLLNSSSNDAEGDPGLIQIFNYTAPNTSVTLRYTYTPSGPVPIPEPGQVAASLLLLGGIGAYVFLKRRKKAATPAA
jgi:hypothetical protein